MPSFSVLLDISQELQAQVIAALESVSDADLSASTSTILLSPPSGDLPDAAAAILYLYHIAIDPYLRNQRLLADAVDPSLFIRPPLPLQLRFLFVPLTKKEDTNQLMLGRVIQHFHDQPTFRPTPGSALATNRGGVPEMIRVRPDFMGFEPLSQLWTAFSRPFRLSAGFLVDIAAVDSGEPAQSTTRVGKSFTVSGKKTAEDAL